MARTIARLVILPRSRALNPLGCNQIFPSSLVLRGFRSLLVATKLRSNLLTAWCETPHKTASPDSDIPDSPVSSTVKNSTLSRITRVIVIFDPSFLCKRYVVSRRSFLRKQDGWRFVTIRGYLGWICNPWKGVGFDRRSPIDLWVVVVTVGLDACLRSRRKRFWCQDLGRTEHDRLSWP